MKHVLTLYLFIALMAFPFAVSAEEETIMLGEVVVTATRYEELISEVPAHVTVITKEEIQNSPAQNIPELLRTVTGIHVNDIAGNNRNYTVDLRGFGETASSNTLVLVDGRRINQADLSGVDWTEIPLERVERIEIIRGGRGSVLYGDNASGGVINIITREGAPLKGGGKLAAGSYDTFKGSAFIDASYDDLSLSLTGKYLTSDGYRDNSATEAKDIGLNLLYEITENLQVHFSTGYHKDNTGLPGALKESDFSAGASRTDTTHPDDYADIEDYYFKIAPEISFLKDSLFKIDMSFRKRAFLSYASGDFGHFTGDSDIHTVIISPQILFKHSIGKAKNILSLGIDYIQSDNDIINESLFFGDSSIGIFDLKKEDFGFYLHDEINIGEIFYLSGGYRHDRADFTFNPGIPDKTDMSEESYTTGINYTFYQQSYIYCSFSRSFRYPLLDELYSFFTNTVNTDLTPQTSDNYEFGIRYYFNDNLYAHLNLFRIDTDHEIIFNPLTYNNENLDGKTRRDGIEISLSAKPIDWFTVKGSYTYLKAEIKEGIFQGQSIPNVPAHKIDVYVLTYPGKGFIVTLNGVYVGKRPFISDFLNEYGNQDSYIILNSKIQYRWKSFTAFLDINNLTNEEYSEFGVIGGFPLEKSFYPSPRINFLAGVSMEF